MVIKVSFEKIKTSKGRDLVVLPTVTNFTFFTPDSGYSHAAVIS